MKPTNTLRFIGVNRDTKTAGPGQRLEFFTKGCIRGVVSPCQGCFNESTWTFEGKSREMTTQEVIDICDTSAWNRQVTFCGGEPILQARALTTVMRELKVIDPTFHFVMYTAYKLDTLMKYGLSFTWAPRHGMAMLMALNDYASSYEDLDNGNRRYTILTSTDVKELMQYVDFVDGDYQQDKRLTHADTMHEGWFIGSANQRVILGPSSLDKGKLVYYTAKEYNSMMEENTLCVSCGRPTRKERAYCNDTCETRHAAHQQDLKQLIGGDVHVSR